MEAQVSETRDKTPRLPGFLEERRNLVVAAIALFAVVVIAFQGATTTKPARVASSAALPTPAPATPAQVKAFSAELKRDTDALAEQRARADAAQTQAQRVLAAQTGQAGPPGTAAYPVGYAQPVASGPPQVAERKRESNIALSFRTGAGSVPAAAPAGAPQPGPDSLAAEQADVRNLIDAEKQALAANIAASQTRLKNASAIAPAPRPDRQADAQPDNAASSPEAPALETYGAQRKTYKLFEGTLIETVLTNRLNGSFTGPVSVLVTTPVYSHDREHVLIPQGSRVIGEATRVGQQGQQRLAVVFHRVLMPDGYSVSLDKFTGLDVVGETGLKDKTDSHWGQIFGTSVALGLVSGFSAFGTGSALTANGVGQYRQGVASSVGQSSTQVLDARLNVLPTITIREGHRVRILLRQDVDVPAYDDHRVPGDI